MIKIIKQGKIQICNCPNCDCKFSYDIQDDIHWADQRHEISAIYCPCCKEEIEFNDCWR